METAGRILQLLPSISLNPSNISISKDNNNVVSEPIDIATRAKMFDDDELQELWKRGVENDEDWRRSRDAVKSGERGFPPDLALKYKVNIAECTVGADGVLRGRENRVWVPDFEPLRTLIIQRTHDSHLAGHPGRDTMVGILLRRWFWLLFGEKQKQAFFDHLLFLNE